MAYPSFSYGPPSVGQRYLPY
ncbi:hypothetical protein LINPERPRIM_LOCUS15041 [Linum perenne]